LGTNAPTARFYIVGTNVRSSNHALAK